MSLFYHSINQKILGNIGTIEFQLNLSHFVVLSLITASVYQIKFVLNGSVPSDLSPALVLGMTELDRLQKRIKQLHAEKSQQKDLYCEAHKHQGRLVHDRRVMDANIQGEIPTSQQIWLKPLVMCEGWIPVIFRK